MSRLEVAVALCCAALLVGDAHAWTRPLARGAPAYRHASRRAGSAPMMVESVEERSIAATASAAAVAANAVARAVTARETSAPSLNANSFVAVDDGNDDDALRALGFGERTINAKNSAGGLYEPGGLPRVYDRTAIEAYWAAEKGELRRRWTEVRSNSKQTERIWSTHIRRKTTSKTPASPAPYRHDSAQKRESPLPNPTDRRAPSRRHRPSRDAALLSLCLSSVCLLFSASSSSATRCRSSRRSSARSSRAGPTRCSRARGRSRARRARVAIRPPTPRGLLFLWIVVETPSASVRHRRGALTTTTPGALLSSLDRRASTWRRSGRRTSSWAR